MTDYNHNARFSHPAIKPDGEAEAPLTRPTNRDPENENIIVTGPFYRVMKNMDRVPLRDYMDHGYETRQDFCDAVRELISRWGGREGECFEERAWHGKEGEAIDQRHRALHLRFHDTPGGLPDEAWLPLYLLEPIPTPPGLIPHEPTEEELLQQEIDEALGFD